MHQVRRPRGQVVENMRRVDNGARSCLRLLFQEIQKVAPRQQVQIDCDFIQEEDRPGP